MSIYEIKLPVQFGDVDVKNRLTMKGALRLMQEAANCHSNQAGYGLNNIEETDFSWVLYQQRCRLLKRPRWNTMLTIRTWSRGADGLICLRDFEVLDESGENVAMATTGWLLVRASTQRMSKLPDGIMDAYGTVERSVFGESLKRLKPLPEAEKTWEYTVLKRDIDINRHVNNLCYLDYALESLPAGIRETDFNDVDIMYKKASYLGDRIACFGGWEMPEGEREKSGAADLRPYVTAVKDPEGKLLHAVVRLERI